MAKRFFLLWILLGICKLNAFGSHGNFAPFVLKSSHFDKKTFFTSNTKRYKITVSFPLHNPSQYFNNVVLEGYEDGLYTYSVMGKSLFRELDSLPLNAPVNKEDLIYIQKTNVLDPYDETLLKILHNMKAFSIPNATRLDMIKEIAAFVSSYLTRDATIEYDINTKNVLAYKRGDCKCYTMLFASLARAAGIPTRPISGLLYSADHFSADNMIDAGAHAWIEVNLNNKDWIPLEPQKSDDINLPEMYRYIPYSFGGMLTEAGNPLLAEGELQALKEKMSLYYPYSIEIQDCVNPHNCPVIHSSLPLEEDFWSEFFSDLQEIAQDIYHAFSSFVFQPLW